MRVKSPNSKKYKLVFAELKRKSSRTLGQILIVSVLSLVIFAGVIILFSLNNGIRSLSDRMGADLMIVPLGYESGAQGIIIKGEPSYFYFDKDTLDNVESCGVQGIEKISAQFYLTSSNQGCCDIPVQFIGIDENTDFTVMPWIRQVFEKAGSDNTSRKGHYLEERSVVVGSDIDVPEDKRIRFFDEYYTVSAQLEETGTGLDQAVFTNMDTTLDLYNAAISKGFNFIEGFDPENAISTIMIKVKDGYSPEQVKHDIRTKIDGLQIIETKSMSTSIENSLKGFVTMLYILIVMLFVLTLIILGVTFRLTILERKKQFEVMSYAGATPAQIVGIVIREALLISVVGTIAGIGIASLFLFPFSTAICQAVSIPFLMPGAKALGVILASVLIIGSITGPLGAFVTLWRHVDEQSYIRYGLKRV